MGREGEMSGLWCAQWRQLRLAPHKHAHDGRTVVLGAGGVAAVLVHGPGCVASRPCPGPRRVGHKLLFTNFVVH